MGVDVVIQASESGVVAPSDGPWESCMTDLSQVKKNATSRVGIHSRMTSMPRMGRSSMMTALRRERALVRMVVSGFGVGMVIVL